jgi:hypothetical protein
LNEMCMQHYSSQLLCSSSIGGNLM